MQAGFIGLGAVVETAWLPALKNLAIPLAACWGFDSDPQRMPEGVSRCGSLARCWQSRWISCLLPPRSLQHLPVLEAALASSCRESWWKSRSSRLCHKLRIYARCCAHRKTPAGCWRWTTGWRATVR
nr:oxidoreductase, NAD-binding [Raoultella sp. NCTC 9187]